ncbi:hypothetical protein C8E87_1984 [Paractinoplanes brasiliensis]|uniref:Uncharacterized protein n=1 Tax=Paractinoplanes brasiliensis TaxID=52695 RepID=A0A4R6JSE1_9ACTN|nr:hypothetical protein C8E87_1984 [Actinoplanes brasiliensis]GID26892.1 hypothetical protein Abr02nite_18750 [Actinoplanes brasiliensis]
MRLELRVEASAEETESLREWLAADRDVQRDGDLRYGRSADPEDQGVDIQVLSLAITSTLTAGNLLVQILNWRRTRSAPAAFTITQERPDGTVVRIESTDPDPSAIAEMARRLESG